MEIINANVKNKNKIIEFIKMCWKKDHIFVKDEKLFDFFHKNSNNNLNFIIAMEGDIIKAILGFLPYTNEENADVFTVLWKSIDNSMCGLECLEYLSEHFKVSSCGINKKTIPIYNFLEMMNGKLNHYYIINHNIDNFKIAKIKNIYKFENINILNENKIIVFNSMNDLIKVFEYNNLKKYNFFKSKEYFEKIYFNHPYYKYEVIGIKNDLDEIKSIMVLREIKVNDAKCLRIIDFLGDENCLINIQKWLVEKLEIHNYEYVDFYQIGIKDEILTKAGFIERKEDDENIIPNYFEPFEQKNVEIYYMTSCKEDFRMFKGDGDQDRPSIPKSEVNI
ncbi:MAG: hypothetical protein LBT51_02655 [Fusobacteriaceae bacterium]|nr:hypothetical protein [Fusobacteriaceae bacterium]